MRYHVEFVSDNVREVEKDIVKRSAIGSYDELVTYIKMRKKV